MCVCTEVGLLCCSKCQLSRLVSSRLVVSWMSSCYSVLQGCESSHTMLPASLFEHQSMGQAIHQSIQKTTPMRNPCPHTPFTSVTTACVSSPERLGCLHRLARAASDASHILARLIPLFELFKFRQSVTCACNTVRMTFDLSHA